MLTIKGIKEMLGLGHEPPAPQESPIHVPTPNIRRTVGSKKIDDKGQVWELREEVVKHSRSITMGELLQFIKDSDFHPGAIRVMVSYDKSRRVMQEGNHLVKLQGLAKVTGSELETFKQTLEKNCRALEMINDE